MVSPGRAALCGALHSVGASWAYQPQSPCVCFPMVSNNQVSGQHGKSTRRGMRYTLSRLIFFVVVISIGSSRIVVRSMRA
jgi:hypothetical protein